MTVKDFLTKIFVSPIPVAARSKAWVCGRSLARIVGSSPSGCVAVCLLLSVVCCQVEYLRRADHSSRGVLLSVLCLSVITNLR